MQILTKPRKFFSKYNEKKIRKQFCVDFVQQSTIKICGFCEVQWNAQLALKLASNMKWSRSKSPNWFFYENEVRKIDAARFTCDCTFHCTGTRLFFSLYFPEGREEIAKGFKNIQKRRNKRRKRRRKGNRGVRGRSPREKFGFWAFLRRFEPSRPPQSRSFSKNSSQLDFQSNPGATSWLPNPPKSRYFGTLYLVRYKGRYNTTSGDRR